MMHKATIISLTAYFLFAALCLPCGDFSLLVELPNMYRHCKAAEDVDMGPMDFLTDHLINFDAAFDQHTGGDKQKPHQSNQTFRGNSNAILFFRCSAATIISPVSQKKRPIVLCEDLYAYDLTSSIFHPPSVVS
ncbi:MAG: hypothetical protein WCI84_04960 [Bacteroidota bacterium]